MRTEVIFTSDLHQEPIKKGATGYIDGYVVGGDGRPCAVVVSDENGYICLAPTYSLKAIGTRE